MTDIFSDKYVKEMQGKGFSYREYIIPLQTIENNKCMICKYQAYMTSEKPCNACNQGKVSMLKKGIELKENFKQYDNVKMIKTKGGIVCYNRIDFFPINNPDKMEARKMKVKARKIEKKEIRVRECTKLDICTLGRFKGKHKVCSNCLENEYSRYKRKESNATPKKKERKKREGKSWKSYAKELQCKVSEQEKKIVELRKLLEKKVMPEKVQDTIIKRGRGRPKKNDAEKVEVKAKRHYNKRKKGFLKRFFSF